MKFTRKISNGWLLTLLLLASAGLSLAGPAFSGRVRSVMHYALAPFGDGGMYVTTQVKAVETKLAAKDISQEQAYRLLEENRQLRGQLMEMEQQRQQLRQQVADIQQIRQLYRPINDIPFELIPARVVAADSLPYGQTRLLNSGVNRGGRVGSLATAVQLQTDRSKALPPNLSAITSSALVGQICETSAFTARLRLLTDSGFQTNAFIFRAIDAAHPRQVIASERGAAAVQTLTSETSPIPCRIRGDGAGAMIVEQVKKYHNVQPGDWLTSSGEGNPPVRIRIGEVAEVKDDPANRGLFVSLVVRPHADVSSLRNVYIIVPLGGKGEPDGGKN